MGKIITGNVRKERDLPKGNALAVSNLILSLGQLWIQEGISLRKRFYCRDQREFQA
jgi:hypothetical protein